jgi:hypothetical protein
MMGLVELRFEAELGPVERRTIRTSSILSLTTAVPGMLYLEPIVLKSTRPQEAAALQKVSRGIFTLVPLKYQGEDTHGS